LWGTFSGSMLPLALRKCRIDPATSSAPFVATLVDVTGLIIYFSIAMLVLRGTLLAAPQSDVVKLGQEKAAQAFDRLLELPKGWETEEAELHTQERKILVTLKESDDLVSLTHCPKCGGKFHVKGHEQPHHQPYLKVFKWDSELVSASPIMQCRKCGFSQTITLPLLTGR